MSTRAAPWLGVLVLVSAFGAPLAGAEPGPAQPAAAFTEQEALTYSQRVVGQSVGDYLFTDRDGRPVWLSRYRGKPLLVSFIYTGCFEVCPTTTRNLARAVGAAAEALGEGAFNVVSIGFNLPFDTPQAMKVFARRQGVTAGNWEFLTPDPATLAQLTRDFGFLYAPSPKGFDHLIQVTLLDAEGRVYRQVYGESFELPMLVEPLKDLITGTPVPGSGLAALVERVRILCTVYDPASGKYRLNYALFIEIFVGASIIGIGLFSLLNEWRKHRGTVPRASH
jgi:protein SCO1/2